MTFYTQSSNGACIPCNPYSSEKDRREEEVVNNLIRSVAHELRKRGHKQFITWRVA